jgi:hypothetical protein
LGSIVKHIITGPAYIPIIVTSIKLDV